MTGRAPSTHHQMVRALVGRLGYLCHSTEQRVAAGGYVAVDLMREADGLAWALDHLAAVGALDVEWAENTSAVGNKPTAQGGWQVRSGAERTRQAHDAGCDHPGQGPLNAWSPSA